MKYAVVPVTPFQQNCSVVWDEATMAGAVVDPGGDLDRGDHATLIRSIKQRLLPLGDDVTFVPGHGPLSTFGHERRFNPFLRD